MGTKSHLVEDLAAFCLEILQTELLSLIFALKYHHI